MLEIRREVKQLRRDGLAARKIATLGEVSQPTIHKTLEVADRDPAPFGGALRPPNASHLRRTRRLTPHSTLKSPL